MDLELNVVRFENEDVIATSSIEKCINIDKTGSIFGFGHTKVTGVNGENVIGSQYDPVNGVLVAKNGITQAVTRFKTGSPTSCWYYYDGSAYVRCENQSDEAHPITEQN